MHPTIRLFGWAAGAACLIGTPAVVQAQADGEWSITANPGASCNVLTGYAPDQGAAGNHGLRLLVGNVDPNTVVLVVGVTPDEVRSLNLSLDSDVPVHLTFFNPDLGNAGMNLSMAVAKDADPADGARNLIGEADADVLRFLRQYHTLDIYLAGSNTRFRRISLVNSGRALDALQGCVDKTLRHR